MVCNNFSRMHKLNKFEFDMRNSGKSQPRLQKYPVFKNGHVKIDYYWVRIIWNGSDSLTHCKTVESVIQFKCYT